MEITDRKHLASLTVYCTKGSGEFAIQRYGTHPRLGLPVAAGTLTRLSADEMEKIGWQVIKDFLITSTSLRTDQKSEVDLLSKGERSQFFKNHSDFSIDLYEPDLVVIFPCRREKSSGSVGEWHDRSELNLRSANKEFVEILNRVCNKLREINP